jgi:hypothetical protein
MLGCAALSKVGLSFLLGRALTDLPVAAEGVLSEFSSREAWNAM